MFSRASPNFVHVQTNEEEPDAHRAMQPRAPLGLFLRFALFSIIGGLCFLSGVLLIGREVRDTLLRADAESVANAWGQHLVAVIHDMPLIMDGHVPSMQTRRFLEQSRQVGTLFRYKIFDRNGFERFVSDNQKWVDLHVIEKGKPSELALEAVRTGKASVSARAGDGISRPLYFASTYMPVRMGGDIVGVVETYVDHSAKVIEIESGLIMAGIKVATITTIAFVLPLGAFLWQVRQRQTTVNRLKHVARHDDLTGLLNRSAFMDVIEARIAQTAPFAVHFVDLDRFKDVNDTHGHHIGDELLRQVSARLIAVAAGEARVARLGGDEFALIQSIRSKDGNEATRFASRIVHGLAVPFTIEGHELRIGASVGIALYPRHGFVPEKLLLSADLALYAAKRSGRSQAVVFEPSIEEERRTRHALETRLREAVEHGGFELNYQPLYATDGVSLRAFEALLRLRDAEGNPIPPSVFIPVAEELRLIDRIGDWVLEEACRTAALWPSSIAVAVNLSPIQFISGALVETVRATLERTGLPPTRLELEVTESVLLENADAVLKQLVELKALNVSIALDDFGTGYSSLSYLWRFPFDTLKVDGSFMQGLNDPTSRSREVLDTIVALGRVLNLHITAEGVETAEQIAVLRELQCDFVQGYLFGRPLSGVDVAATILRAALQEKGSRLREIVAEREALVIQNPNPAKQPDLHGATERTGEKAA